MSLDRIARAHIKRGYPGIAYDFVVDVNGEIFKTTELEDVAQPDQVWSEQGVNICLTGNFHQGPPPLPQLDAAGRLCAWLAQNLGLTADAIVGLGRTDRQRQSRAKPSTVAPHGKRCCAARCGCIWLPWGWVRPTARSCSRSKRRLPNWMAKTSGCAGKPSKNAAEAVRLQQAMDRMQAELIDLRRQLEARPTVVEGGLRLNVLDRSPAA